MAGLPANFPLWAAVEHYQLLLQESGDADEDSSAAAGLGVSAECGSSDVQQQQQQRVQAAVAVVAPAVHAALAAPLTAPAEAEAVAALAESAAAEWALVQSDAPLRQLTTAKALALLRRDRPPWLCARFWTVAAPALAKRLEALVYQSAASADLYRACSLNERLLEGCSLMLRGMKDDTAFVKAAAQYELPELSDDDALDADTNSTEHTAAADSVAVESAKARAVGVADLVADAEQQRQQEQCEQHDSVDSQACAAVKSAASAVAAAEEAVAVADASCTQQTASTEQTADDNEQQQQQVVVVTPNAVAELCSTAALSSAAVDVLASDMIRAAEGTDAQSESLSAATATT